MDSKSNISEKHSSTDTNGNETAGRVEVAKTYKLYIGGSFPRTESGRYLPVKLKGGQTVNVCRASRKDLRNAIVAAQKGFAGWKDRTAYNRSQIIYRMAEMMEGRKQQFIYALEQQGVKRELAIKDVDDAIDCLIHYAGWCDKFIQIFSTVNPVADSYFNFSVPEPMGVVGLIIDQDAGLSGFISQLLPIITGSNAAVILVPPDMAPFALDFAEVLRTSDLPAGVVNVLTGETKELLDQFGTHLDLNAVVIAGTKQNHINSLKKLAATHVLRVIVRDPNEILKGPYPILDTQEIKTTWHPVGK